MEYHAGLGVSLAQHLPWGDHLRMPNQGNLNLQKLRSRDASFLDKKDFERSSRKANASHQPAAVSWLSLWSQRVSTE